MTVLSDERLREICASEIEYDVPFAYARAVERAVVADLAARGGVDVDALIEDNDVWCVTTRGGALRTDGGLHDNEIGARSSCIYDNEVATHCVVIPADALRLALAQQAAQYEAREAKWRELDALYQRATVAMLGSEVVRVTELRRELVVE